METRYDCKVEYTATAPACAKRAGADCFLGQMFYAIYLRKALGRYAMMSLAMRLSTPKSRAA